MSDWLRRFHRSRRARNWTLGAIGLVTFSSCTGALLANFTAAGMNTLPSPRTVASAGAEHGPADSGWVHDVALVTPAEPDAAPADADATYQQASY